MYKQSASIIALFLGSSCAVRIHSSTVGAPAKGGPAPEKLQDFDPIVSQGLSNSRVAELPAYPAPVGLGAGRTAFYVQEDDSNSMPPSAAFTQREKSDIGKAKINESVHVFSSDDTNVLPLPWRRATEPYPPNGFKNPSWQWATGLAEQKHHHHHKHHHKDIGDNGIDEEVHGFATADKSVLPLPWRRVQQPYPPNGFKNPTWQWLLQAEKRHHHRHHKHHKDIGDNGIDEEVHGFATADKSVLPLPWRRAKEAYPPNGFKNPTWQWLNQETRAHNKDKMDIGDKAIDQEVQGFASEDRNVLPEPWRRSEDAFPANGGQNPKWQHLSLTQARNWAPEKVVDLKPQEYQGRANTNTPNLRTTFYAQSY